MWSLEAAMRRYHDSTPEEGLILRLTPFRERDMMVSLLSEHSGKDSLLWRAARDKSTGGVMLDIGDIVRLEVSRAASGPSILSKINSISSPQAARKNFDSMTLLSLLIEIADRTIPEHVPDGTELYDIVSLGVKALNEQPTQKEALRAVTLTLGTLGNLLGCISNNDLKEPSSKMLRLIIHQFEMFIGKPLNTRSSVEEILRGLSQPVQQ